MAHLSAIFLDDGDVMNDNEVRGRQWRRLLPEFFVPRLGGSKEDWAEANRVVFANHWDMLVAGPGTESLRDWWNRYQLMWLSDMAKHVGVSAPESDEDCISLAREASEFVTRRTSSAFPGAVGAVKSLSAAGFELFTASSEVSWELNGYLQSMGVRDLFTQVYGVDLIDCWKDGVKFYERMFEHSGKDPAESMVVDDKEQNLEFAASLGARTCLISRDQPEQITSDRLVISSLADLPRAIEAAG